MRLIDAEPLYERLKELEELARRRVIDTPSRFPNGEFNPYAMRYATQLEERTSFREMLSDAPTIEAESVRYHALSQAIQALKAEPYREFAEWVAGEIFDDFEHSWSLEGFAEVACRRLAKLALVEEQDGKWVYERRRNEQRTGN